MGGPLSEIKIPDKATAPQPSATSNDSSALPPSHSARKRASETQSIHEMISQIYERREIPKGSSIAETPYDSLALLQGILEDLEKAQKEAQDPTNLSSLSAEEKENTIRNNAKRAINRFSGLKEHLEECWDNNQSALRHATKLSESVRSEIEKDKPDFKKIQQDLRNINRITMEETKKLFMVKTDGLINLLDHMKTETMNACYDKDVNRETFPSAPRLVLKLEKLKAKLREENLDLPKLHKELQQIRSIFTEHLLYGQEEKTARPPSLSPLHKHSGIRKVIHKPEGKSVTTEWSEKQHGKFSKIKVKPEDANTVLAKLEKVHIMLLLADHPNWFEVRRHCDDCIRALEKVEENHDNPLFIALKQWRKRAEQFSRRELEAAGFIVPDGETIRDFREYLSELRANHIDLQDIPFSHRAFGEDFEQVTRVEGRWPIDVSFSHFMVWEQLTDIGLSWEGLKKEHAEVRAEKLFQVERFLDTVFSTDFVISQEDFEKRTDDEKLVLALREKFATLHAAKENLERRPIEIDKGATNPEQEIYEGVLELEAKISEVVNAENEISSLLHQLQQTMQQQWENRHKQQTSNRMRSLTRDDWNAKADSIERIEEFLQMDQQSTLDFLNERNRFWGQIIQTHRAVEKRMGLLANDAIDNGINELTALSDSEKQAFFHLCKGLFMGNKGIAKIENARDRAFYQQLVGSLLEEEPNQNIAERIEKWREQAGQFREGEQLISEPGEDGFGKLPVPARFLRACEDRIAAETSEEFKEYYPSAQDCQKAIEMYREVLKEITPYSLLFDQLEHYRGPDRYATEEQEYPDRDPFFGYVDIVLDDVIQSTVPETGQIFNLDGGETLQKMFNEYSEQNPDYRKPIVRYGERLFNAFKAVKMREHESN